MTKCPPEFYECLTEEQYDEILDILDENELANEPVFVVLSLLKESKL